MIKLTLAQTKALKYYACLHFDSDYDLRHVSSYRPSVGTRVALINRGLLSSGVEHTITPDGWDLLDAQ